MAKEAVDLVQKVLIWGSVGGCLSFFNKVFKQKTWLTSLLAEASFTVFLFSHCLIVIAGLVLTQMSFHYGVKFLLVSLLGLIIPLLIHVLLIRRFASLRFLYNGH